MSKRGEAKPLSIGAALRARLARRLARPRYYWMGPAPAFELRALGEIGEYLKACEANGGEGEFRVAEDEFPGVRVSTVFLHFDHAHEGPPQLFETMVFGGELGGEQLRCSTRDEALAQHAAVLARVRAARQRRLS